MSDDPKISRRRALNRLWQISGLAVGGSCGLISVRFLASRAPETDFGKVINAGSVENIPPNSVTVYENARMFLVRAADGGFLALYTHCTHLDCVVQWRKSEDHFFCPCHGSQFTADGTATKGPATIPLIRFPVTIEDGRVKVDTSMFINRTQAAPEDFTYAPESSAPESSQ